MKHQESDDFARQIARYNQELLQTSRRSAFPDAVPQPPAGMDLPIRETANEPFPDSLTGQSAPMPQDASDAPAPDGAESSSYPRDETGYLQVQVFTAREATPLVNAHVHIYEATDAGDSLVTSAFSDISGFSPVFSLPGVSNALSLQPGFPHPYVSYAVQVDHPGYYRVRTENVPVFSGVVSRQPIFMVPMPEQETGSDIEIRYPNTDADTLNS